MNKKPFFPPFFTKKAEKTRTFTLPKSPLRQKEKNTMWLTLAFLSAIFMGCYDLSKKLAVNHNAILPVLLVTTLFSTLLMTPLWALSTYTPDLLRDTPLYIPRLTLYEHGLIFVRSVVVIATWLAGYNALKHLPITLMGPINATRPVMTLLLAMPLFGDKLNTYQWIGVLFTILSLYLLSATGKKEGITFTQNKWVLLAFLGAFLGSANELYEKFIMPQLPVAAVLFWFSLYQFLLFLILVATLWYPKRKTTIPFEMRGSILLISLFIILVDFTGLYALSDPDSMVSIVSLIKRGSVLVSFAGGAFLLHEKNLKGKIIDLILIFIGMLFLFWGTK